MSPIARARAWLTASLGRRLLATLHLRRIEAVQVKLQDIEEKDKPKRRPIPGHIPHMEVEPTPGADARADGGGRQRRIGEHVTEELE